jgi:hypothetical protein
MRCTTAGLWAIRTRLWFDGFVCVFIKSPLRFAVRVGLHYDDFLAI